MEVTMSRLRIWWLSLICICAWPVTSPAQIVLNQVDNFQDGSLYNWTNGFGASDPLNIPTGGPAGVGDRYLQVSSGTFGGGIRSIVFNPVQWLGNYPAAGVTRVEMDLANFGTSALSMRYALRSSSGGSFTPGYVSTVAFNLPADGVWRHAIFLLDAASLTAINSPPPLATFLTSVGDARILDAATPSLLGDAINSQFGIDNIKASAAAVPEPATWILMLLGLTGAITYLIRMRYQQQRIMNKECVELEEASNAVQ